MPFIGRSGYVTSNGAAPGAITPHASTQNGDLLIFHHYSAVTGGNETAAVSGWTVILNAVSATYGLVHASYHVRAAGETTYTAAITNHTAGTSGETVIEWIDTWRGQDSTTPVGSASAAVSQIASTTTTFGPISAPASASLPDGDTVVVWGGLHDDFSGQTVLSGDSLTWSLQAQTSSTSGADAGICSQFGANGSGSAKTVTAKTITISGAATAGTGYAFMYTVHAAPAPVSAYPPAAEGTGSAPAPTAVTASGVQQRGTGTSGQSGAATSTGAITLPGGWQAGDLLTVMVRAGATGQDITQTGGTGSWARKWNSSWVTGGYTWAVFTRTMAGGDTAPTFGWATSTSVTWACAAFYDLSGGLPTVIDSWGTGDPLEYGTAGTTVTPDAGTAAGGGEASVILTSARATTTGTGTAGTYTPPAGYTTAAEVYVGAANSRWTGIALKTGIAAGAVTPGSESLTDDLGHSFYFAAVHLLVTVATPVTAPAGAAAGSGSAPQPTVVTSGWSNTFESVTPSGTTLTQGSGGNTAGGGSYFDVVSIGSGATCVSDSAYAAHGTLSNKLATGATAAGVYVGWTTSIGSRGEFWFRVCERFTAAPAANYRIAQFGTGTAGIFLRYDTAGKIEVVSLADSSILTTTTVAVPTGQWIRVEGHVVMSTTTGSVQLKVWNSADSAGAADDDHTASGLNLGAASLSAYSFGLAGTSTANVAAWWQDDPAVSVTGWIGPAGAPAGTAYAGAAAGSGAAPAPSTFPPVTGPTGWELGMGVSGAEWYTDPTGATSPTSNRSKGTYNSDYHYEGVDSTSASNRRSFDYLYSRGWRTVKIPVLWERLTDSPGSALNATQVTYLTELLDRANDAGLKVTLDPHNYGNYYLDGADGGGGAGGVAGTGYRYPINCAPTGLPTGDTTVRVTQAHFADFWSRVTTQFLSHPAVTGVHLINEPNPGGGLTQAAWYSAAQAAVNAIRAVDTAGLWTIRIGGWHWSDCYGWDGYNTSGLVVSDPAGSGKVWYEAHHYWWAPGSGGYGTYAASNDWAAANGYANPAPYADSLTAWVIDDLERFTSWVHTNAPGGVPLIGEIGIPSTADTEFTPGDQAKWDAALYAYITRCGQLGVHLDPWVAGETYGAGRLTIYSASSGRTTGLDTRRATAPPWEAATTGPRSAAASAGAGSAAGSGAASGPSLALTLAPPAGQATGTGTAPQPTVTTASLGTGNAGPATGTGAAAQPTAAAGVPAGAAAGTGTAQQPSAAVTVTPTAGQATGTGTAPQATVTTASPGTGNAGPATGTGAAPAPSLILSSRAPAGAPAGTGTAAQPSAAAGVPAGAAAGTGTAPGPGTSLTLGAAAGTAAGSGAAPPASISTIPATSAPAGTAAGTGTAPPPSLTLTSRAPAGQAAGTGTAPPPAGQAGRPAPAGAAAGSGSAPQPSAALATRATAPAAAGSGAAPQPVVATAIPAVYGTATAEGAPTGLATIDGGPAEPAAATDGRVLQTASTSGRP